jgi:hypothetical protein
MDTITTPRRIEMHDYRQVLERLRQGDSDRDIARSGLIGRPKAAALRGLAVVHGWLDPAAVVPDDAALAAPARRFPRRAVRHQNVSCRDDH